MKSKIAAFSLLVTGVFASWLHAGEQALTDLGSPPNIVETSDTSVIKGLQAVRGYLVVFTGRDLYTTDDNGANWAHLDVQLGLTESIAGVDLRSDRSIRVVIASRASFSLYLAATEDRGRHWTRHRVSLDEQFLGEADLSNIKLSTENGRIRIRLRLASSSNFDRFVLYDLDEEISELRFIESRSDLSSGTRDDLNRSKFDRLKLAAGLADEEDVIDAADSGDAAILDRDVRGKRRPTGSIDNRAGAY